MGLNLFQKVGGGGWNQLNLTAYKRKHGEKEEEIPYLDPTIATMVKYGLF